MLRVLAGALVGLLLVACTAGDAGAPVVSPSNTRSMQAPVPRDSATAAATVRPVTSGPPLALALRLDGPDGSVAGLDVVDVVVEYPRGGDTAALAITDASDGVVGPLRPATADDAALARAWAADIVATVSDADVRAAATVLEEGRPAGVVLRDPSRRAPHNAYAVIAAARDAEVPRRSGGLPPVWISGPPPPVGGRPVAEVVVDGAAPVTWTYDPGRGTWVRSTSQPPAAQADGSPIAAHSVVVAEFALPGRAGALPEFGTATVLRAGRRYGGRWVSEDRRTPLRVEQADGAPFPLAGTVWLQLCASPCAQQIAPSAPRPDGGPR